MEDAVLASHFYAQQLLTEFVKDPILQQLQSSS